LAIAELIQLTVEFRINDMFIFHLMYHIKIFEAMHEAKIAYMRTRPVLTRRRTRSRAKPI